MVEHTTRDRVDAFWSQTLHCSAADLHAPGVRVLPNPPQRQDWRGVYVLVFDGASVFAPADQLAAVTAAVSGHDAESLLEAKTWQDILGRSSQAVGPLRHYYLDDKTKLVDCVAGRRLNPTDSDALARLRAALPTTDWVSAGFTGQASLLFGLHEGDDLVAAANLTPGPCLSGSSDAATDVGFVVHPAARGRGYGTSIAALAARQAIAMHGIARYRALLATPSTMAIAERLGFTEYGRNLVAYLNDASLVPVD